MRIRSWISCVVGSLLTATALASPAAAQLSEPELKARVCYIDPETVVSAVTARYQVRPEDIGFAPFDTAISKATTDELNRQGCALLLQGRSAPLGSKDFTAIVLETVVNQRPTTGGPLRFEAGPGICVYSSVEIEEADPTLSQDRRLTLIRSALEAKGCRLWFNSERVLAKGASVPILTAAIVAALPAFRTAPAKPAPGWRLVEIGDERPSRKIIWVDAQSVQYSGDTVQALVREDRETPFMGLTAHVGTIRLNCRWGGYETSDQTFYYGTRAERMPGGTRGSTDAPKDEYHTLWKTLCSRNLPTQGALDPVKAALDIFRRP